MSTAHIRNFCIIAHIDHGKSTLADRLLEETHTLAKKDMKAQVLDSMDLERERGITIKSHPIQMQYTHTDQQKYIFNLIDTPGHVDFTYEVSRSLAACEGALLLVDAAQGVEAQTVSNAYLAIENDLTIIPIINKVDLSSARVEEVKGQLIELIGCDEDEIICASAKSGIGIQDVFDAVVDRIPPPDDRSEGPLRAMVFDSVHDNYKGAIPYVRIFDGVLKAGTTAKFFAHNRQYDITEVGHFILKQVPAKELRSGDVGYLLASIRDVSHILPGDTITTKANAADEALPGFKPSKPVVFCGLFPVDSSEYQKLKDGLAKLKLNDSSFSYEPESSSALGLGFRCGFLGLLHLEIVTQRLEREFDLNLITTTPGVIYKINQSNGKQIELQNPTNMPDPTFIKSIEEPWIKATIIAPDEYLGSICLLYTSPSPRD